MQYDIETLQFGNDDVFDTVGQLIGVVLIRAIFWVHRGVEDDIEQRTITQLRPSFLSGQ